MFTRLLIKTYKAFGVMLMILGILLLLAPVLLKEQLEFEAISAKTNDSIILIPATYHTKQPLPQLPPVDPKLPQGHIIKIPRIGVYTSILESKNPNAALRKGVWRVYNFATPISQKHGFPIILAAHRFGYITWSPNYRRKNSFAYINQLKNGDIIYIYWDQREFKYQVIKKIIDTKIPTYTSDLILYTCVTFNSPRRLFVLAKRIK